MSEKCLPTYKLIPTPIFASPYFDEEIYKEKETLIKKDI
jgi:hypothetical protein